MLGMGTRGAAADAAFWQALVHSVGVSGAPLGGRPQRRASRGAGHIDLQTGASVENTLRVPGEGMAKACFWPDCDLVLVLVDRAIRIFASSGTLLHTTNGHDSVFDAWLGPAGQAAAFTDRHRVLWLLWNPSAGSVSQAGLRNVMQLAWATPFSGLAVALLHAYDQDGYKLYVSSQRQIELGTTITQAVDAEFCRLAWGSKLAVLATSTQLHVYALRDHSRTWERTVSPERGRVYACRALALSANRALGALVTGTDTGRFQQHVGRHLAVLHLASGHLREYPLSDMHLAASLRDYDVCVCWSLDG